MDKVEWILDQQKEFEKLYQTNVELNSDSNSDCKQQL